MVFFLVLLGSLVLWFGVARVAKVIVDASKTFPTWTFDVWGLAKWAFDTLVDKGVNLNRWWNLFFRLLFFPYLLRFLLCLFLNFNLLFLLLYFLNLYLRFYLSLSFHLFGLLFKLATLRDNIYFFLFLINLIQNISFFLETRLTFRSSYFNYTRLVEDISTGRRIFIAMSHIHRQFLRFICHRFVIVLSLDINVVVLIKITNHEICRTVGKSFLDRCSKSFVIFDILVVKLLGLIAVLGLVLHLKTSIK